MAWLIVFCTFASVIAFVLTLRMVMGDDHETRELKARLRFYGVEPRRFSSSCLTELNEIGTRHLRLVERPIETELRTAIDRVAIEIRGVSLGLHGSTAADLRCAEEEGCGNPFWIVLARHDPLRYALPNLAKTQARNREIAGR